MAGSFGYKVEYYDLAVEIGEGLWGQLDAADADHVLTSGTSCTEQIGSVGDAEPLHPAKLVAPDGR